MTAAALPFLLLGGSAMQAIGSIRQGNAAADAAKYNAGTIEQQAATGRQQATEHQELQRQRAREQLGTQLAATAQSGTGIDGSNLDLLRQSMYEAEMERLGIRYDNELNARGLEAQAAMTRQQGKNARTAGYLSAASQLVQGATSYISQGGTLPRMNTTYFRTDETGMEFGRMSRDYWKRSERRGY